MASSSGVVGFDGSDTTRLSLPSVVVSSTRPGNDGSDRARGLQFDFGVHDICDWFSEDEIAEIAAPVLAVDQSVYTSMNHRSTPGLQHSNVSECGWSFDEVGLVSMVQMPPRISSSASSRERARSALSATSAASSTMSL